MKSVMGIRWKMKKGGSMNQSITQLTEKKSQTVTPHTFVNGNNLNDTILSYIVHSVTDRVRLNNVIPNMKKPQKEKRSQVHEHYI